MIVAVIVVVIVVVLVVEVIDAEPINPPNIFFSSNKNKSGLEKYMREKNAITEEENLS